MILHENITALNTFINLVTDFAYFKDLEGRYIYCNDLFLSFIQKPRDEVINKSDFEIFPHIIASNNKKSDLEALLSKQVNSFEEIFIKEDGCKSYLYTTKQMIYDTQNNPLGLFCISQDNTYKKQYEIIYEDNKLILEYIAVHDNLTQVLDKIVYLSEKRNINAKSSILLLDKEKKRLFNGSSPNLPDFYNKAVDGIEIGENIGSCASAVYKKERVVVENINTHSNWSPFLDLTRKANLHACWSEPIFSSTNEVLGSFAIYHDVPKKPSHFELKLINSYAHLVSVAIEKEANRIKLQERENELEQLFQNALVGLMYLTGERTLIKGNQRLADIFGYKTPDEMTGINMREFHLSDEMYERFGKNNFESLKDRISTNVEFQLQRKDGTHIWCELSGSALDKMIPADLNKGVLWTVNDISERKQLEQKVQNRTKEIEYTNGKLKVLASTDYLTGLYNRSKLDEILESNFKRSKRHNCHFGLILIDIDLFKDVNDTYGHQVGDDILCEISNIFLHSSRETDVVGRWGGEEFLIIVENTNKKSLITFSEKLRRNVEKNTFSVVNNKTISLGVTLYSKGDTISDLISRVDSALYTSKHNGRNMVSYL